MIRDLARALLVALALLILAAEVESIDALNVPIGGQQ